MRFTLKIVSVLFLSLLMLSFAQASNTYIVTFSEVDFGMTAADYTNFSFAMTIDDLGNVISGPKQLHNINWTPGPEITAIAQHNSSTINLWIQFGEGNVRHGFITSSTLAASALTKLPLSFNDNTTNLQTTLTGKFLATVKSNFTAQAFGVTSEGAFTGKSWGLSPRTRRGNPFVGLSSDGLLAIGSAVASNSVQLYAQSLNPVTNLPSGTPKLIANKVSAISPDVTNVLSGNQRFVIYRDQQVGLTMVTTHGLWQTPSWALNSQRSAAPTLIPPEGRILLEQIDATTNAPLSPAKTLLADGFANMNVYDTLAIDPTGHFYVYGLFNGTGCDDLFFQALDATGSPSGSAKKLLTCNDFDGGFYGLDILKQ